ncbi:hypothetical protein HOLleu_11287 [Holothuria leucospilota]|uniref:Uncharacterized protein n=1 Tax=Holothuria leucospilota TaxID=206669 RepID=A0A9Q1CG19_HOLLE|nr:hypothetical protein HOLleu_11287 [Holothuria leucospilota]
MLHAATVVYHILLEIVLGQISRKIMDVTKGLIGRRICGSVEFIVGAIIIVIAALRLEDDYIDIGSFLIGGFVILKGLLGVASKSTGVIIAYLVTSIICTLYFGYSTIASLLVILQYKYWGTRLGLYAHNSVYIILIVSVAVFTIAFIVSVSGVIFSTLPWCGNSQGREMAQQYSDGTAPNGNAGPSSGYNNNAYVYGGYTHLGVHQPQYANVSSDRATSLNNSNTTCINTTQTLQYYRSSTFVGADGLPGYNYINTAYEDPTQNQRCIQGNTSAGAVGQPSYHNSHTAYINTQAQQSVYGNLSADEVSLPRYSYPNHSNTAYVDTNQGPQLYFVNV